MQFPGNPVDGTWSAWTLWSSCSASCGSGKKFRNHTCLYSSDCRGGSCEGPIQEENSCAADLPCRKFFEYVTYTTCLKMRRILHFILHCLWLSLFHSNFKSISSCYWDLSWSSNSCSSDHCNRFHPLEKEQKGKSPTAGKGGGQRLVRHVWPCRGSGWLQHSWGHQWLLLWINFQYNQKPDLPEALKSWIVITMRRMLRKWCWS